MTIEEELLKRIELVLGDFDYEKVHSVMTFLGWRWGSCGSVPTQKQIRDRATELFATAIDSLKNDNWQSSHSSLTGGLIATVERDHVGLEFVLTKTETELENGVWG